MGSGMLVVVVFSSVELPRFGVLGGVGSDVGAVEGAEVSGGLLSRCCMSRRAEDMLGEVKWGGVEGTREGASRKGRRSEFVGIYDPPLSKRAPDAMAAR